MSADVAALILTFLAAPPLTLFVPYYGWVARRSWWRNPAGRAVMVSTFGLALLVDISVLYLVFGDDYPGRDAVRLTVYSLIVAGAYLILGALIYESRKGRQHPHRRQDQLDR